MTNLITGSYDANYYNLASAYSYSNATNNPAAISIASGLESQTNGYDTGYDNAAVAKDLLNVSDGALSSITESLQRIRELSVQASNSTYTAQDKQSMQDEVEQLKQGIQATAKNTEFNTLSLLDGSTADLNLATNPDGTGMEIQMVNTTLESLGIANYDLTGDFDISTIDDALKAVSDAQSKGGATSNVLTYTMNSNSIASYNLTSTESNLEDMDFEKYVSDMNKKNIMEQYQYFLNKKDNEKQSSMYNLLL